MSKKVKIFIIVLFVAYAVFTLFQIGKIIYYSGHRELTSIDYQEIIGTLLRFCFCLLWFIFAMHYHSKGKHRVLSIVCYSFCSLLFCLEIYSKIKLFNQLFIGTEYWTPPFIDKFTSLFELCYIIIFAVAFVSAFIYLLRRNYFSKLS